LEVDGAGIRLIGDTAVLNDIDILLDATVMLAGECVTSKDPFPVPEMTTFPVKVETGS
jgi:hypothetical protein